MAFTMDNGTTTTDLHRTLSRYGQQHLLGFWSSLLDKEKQELESDINDINIEEVVAYFKASTKNSNDDKETLSKKMKPVPSNLYGGVNRTTNESLKSYEIEGLNRISMNEVGVLLLAGGQGTRLGVSYPKGMFDVGLPSHKTLYQIQAERIQRLMNLAHQHTGNNCIITWFIMTSDHTKESTTDFFKKHNYFGLDKNNIIIFEQFLLPAFTFDGKIILKNTRRISKSPDGNGGLYKALRDRKILDEIDKRGIKYLHAHSVDNILVKVADPIFIGYCIKKEADCGAKVVEKSFPTEAAGVVCTIDGKYHVVEYSEITLETAEKLDENGKLVFNAANICDHFFTSSFLREFSENYESQLKLHIAKKKIPFVDNDGNLIIPKKPNGIKMEKFIFDAFPFSNKLAVWEVNRADDFSPLKNSDDADKDNPTSSRNSIYALHKKYVENAGGVVENDGEPVICEISPLLSYAGEGLEDITKNKHFKSPVLLKSKNETSMLNGANGVNGVSK